MSPQLDENYQRGVTTSADIGSDKGVPLAFYIHNIMPSAVGYQSIGYTKVALPITPPAADFDRAFPLLQELPNNAHTIFSPSSGKNYIYDATNGGWKSINPLLPGTASDAAIVTTSTITGDTFIFYQGIGCFRYDQVAKALVSVILIGLDPTTIIGITDAFGYLIAWSANSIAWSSVLNPLDFTPSLITGAGGGSINDIGGAITQCVPISGGFLVFCEKNTVSAKYTGNIRFPFIFKELANAGGVEFQDQICTGSGTGAIYIWSSVGVQRVTLTTCEDIFPEATDFLAKLIFEDFDEVSLSFTETNLTSQLSIRLAYVCNRFMVFSYGVSYPNFTHAIIYDDTLKRWGKIKLPHRCCFQWNVPNLFGAVTYGQVGALGLTYGDLKNITYGQFLTSTLSPELPLKALAFLQADGTVYTVNFDYAEVSATPGVILLGKFQYQRNKRIVHQYSDFENVLAASPFSVYVVPTLNGKDLLPPVPAVQIKKGILTQRWAKRIEGQNYSLLAIGNFNLTSVLTDFTLGGDR
jgi:hypothetical protein